MSVVGSRLPERGDKMSSEEHENRMAKLEHDMAIAHQKAVASESAKKAVLKKVETYTRSQRTHRLCQQGALLGRKLKEPDLLTEEQVETILNIAFAHSDVQEILKKYLDERSS